MLAQTNARLDRLRSTMFVYLPHRSQVALGEHLRLIELLEGGGKDEVEACARWHKLRTVEAYRAMHATTGHATTRHAATRDATAGHATTGRENGGKERAAHP
jgi:DNA-binding GntR family transcriptional regulator